GGVGGVGRIIEVDGRNCKRGKRPARFGNWARYPPRAAHGLSPRANARSQDLTAALHCRGSLGPTSASRQGASGEVCRRNGTSLTIPNRRNLLQHKGLRPTIAARRKPLIS